MGTKEVAKNAVKAAEEGVNLVYRHYGNDISKYFQGALKWLRNARKGSIPEKVEPIEKAIDLNLYKGAEELFERYNDSTIQSLLNDVAQVPNKRSAINYAKAGLKIPKYQNPASTIERTSEP